MDVMKEKQPGAGPKDPVKRTVRDWTGPMKEKSILNCVQVEKFVSRSAVVRWCEQWGRMRLRIPMRAIKVEKLVLNVRVGECVDRLVLAEKALQQAERRILSYRKSRMSGRRQEKSPDVDEVIISALQKTIEVFRKRTIKEVIDFTNTTCRTSRQPLRKGTPVAVLVSGGWMCGCVAMTSACSSGMENAIEVPTWTQSRVARTRANSSVVQERLSS